MAGLQSPLSTLRHTPHDAQRMTRGQCGLLFLHCTGLSPATPCRSPGALACFKFHFVSSPPKKPVGSKPHIAVRSVYHLAIAFHQDILPLDHPKPTSPC